METCTNCGASLRPGAKFCTTCGTRLNETSASSTSYQGWGTPTSEEQSDSQQTSVLNAVDPAANSEEAPSIRGGNQRSAASWGSAYSGGSSASGAGNDPASRFISALDGDVKPTPESPTAEATSTDDSWGKPAFTPPTPSNWSYSGGVSESDTSEKATANDTDSAWSVPSTWTTPADTSTESNVDEDDAIDAAFSEEIAEAEEVPTNTAPVSTQETDSAGFTDDGDDEVDYLSGDENIEVAGPETPALAPNDARTRAIELVDELRRMVRMMGSGTESDPGAAAMALTEAVLNVGDYDDVRSVLADIQEDPRDIHALSNLAKKADKIEALLAEHQSLVDAIETATRDLTG